jgi:hypothetical protein
LAVIPRRKPPGLANSKIAGTVRVLASTTPPTAISLPFLPGSMTKGWAKPSTVNEAPLGVAQPADLAFRHARFQPQPAGVGDMEQRRALGDEGARRHGDIGQRAINRRADGDAARSPQLSLPRLRRIGFGFGHALVGAGFEQAPSRRWLRP